jgi:lactobin A/cerein 7B family class IIb bacteriocin
MEKFKELSIAEMQEVEGGLGLIETIVAGLVIAAGAAIIDDWDNFKRGLNGAPPVKQK